MRGARAPRQVLRWLTEGARGKGTPATEGRGWRAGSRDGAALAPSRALPRLPVPAARHAAPPATCVSPVGWRCRRPPPDVGCRAATARDGDDPSHDSALVSLTRLGSKAALSKLQA